MGLGSISHVLLILIVVLFVFGAGRLPSIMADLGKGLKAFKKGLMDEKEAHLEDKTQEDK